MGVDEATVASFPTYADLTQTQGWAGAPTKQVSSALDDTVELVVDDVRRYTESTLLGVGGMGKVLLAHDARIGRHVALKQLHTDRELAPEERARFLREARVQGQLEHPSIVPVYDIDQRSDGTTFFTMRRVLGRTLHAILDDLRAGNAAARARYTQRELLTAFATICLTIDYAHSRGVIHRDLKPANVMLGDFGEVYVLDWGLARLVDETAPAAADSSERLSMPGELMGTPLYMAPEQMVDPSVGPAADVFALGAMLFEILTLERLRDARSLYLPAEARPSVRAPARGIAPELETICVRATESLPEERYPTPRALQEAVVRFLEGDRELEQRRELAAHHARRAREALAQADVPGADYERDRGTAIRELVRALALEPTNVDHVAMLGEIMGTPPRTTPPAVLAALAASEDHVVRAGAKYSMLAGALWFTFVPLLMIMGIQRWYQVAFVLIPIALASLVSFIATRQRVVPRSIHFALVVFTLIACAATSRMYGPLVLTPTLIATFALVFQAHPQRAIRVVTYVLGCLALAVPALLELVIPSSYAFEAGRMVIQPQMHALPPTASILLLTGASLAMMIVPSAFIGSLRVALSDTQRQLLVQSWHYRRLGAELTHD